MKINRPKTYSEKTHGGAKAFSHLTPKQALDRSVMSCFLWEREFYEDGVDIAQRIIENANRVDIRHLASTCIKTRKVHNLRHVPLLLLTVLAARGRGTSLVSDTIEKTISRADELTELLAVYATVNGVTPDKLKSVLSGQMKKGIAKAFHHFDEYQLAKYNRKGAVTLADAMCLCHPKPKGKEQAELWKRLLDNKLETPDTWEVQLSAGGDKGEVFTRLLTEKKLGYMALLRNLRNMHQSKVDPNLVREALENGNSSTVLPFRFVAAARAVPEWESMVDKAMQNNIYKSALRFPGRTVILVDVSGSMNHTLSQKSDMTRMTAAAALAAIFPGEMRVFTFSNEVVEVPPRMGMAGVDAIIKSQRHMGTRMHEAVERMNLVNNEGFYDRIVVLTDEQSTSYGHGHMAEPNYRLPYMINVGSYKNGVGYGRWTHIDGFSESVLRFMSVLEENRV